MTCPKCHSPQVIDQTGKGDMACMSCRYKWRAKARDPRVKHPPTRRGPAS